MAKFKLRNFAIAVLHLCCLFIDLTNCESPPKLEIYPTNDVQRKPVGKPLILTCRPRVTDPSLVTDLQWKDSMNITILPKPNNNYYPLYDSKGRRLPTVVGRNQPPMYTETLPGESLALMISTLTPQMEGKYYCTASYANTEILQTSVEIKTYVSITWTDAPENQYPTLGSDYVVKCEVRADPNPTVDWMRNGDQIRTNDKYVVQTDGLLIRNVQESDDGVYTCRAAVIETGELVERVIRVEVYIKPVITYFPSTLEAVEGKSFQANCSATGKPVPEISWIKDSTQQNVATADRFKVNPQTGLMTINSVSQDDYDTYTCIARNDAGVTDSKTKLNVLVRPTIFELYNITGVAMKEVALTCRSKGRPAPAITFRRWGSEEEYVPGVQPDDDRVVLQQHFDDEKGESSGTLRISNSVRTDDGLYQCIARNKGDTAFKTGHITMEFPPDFSHMKDLPPTFSWEQKPANLSCLAMSIPNATIEWRWNGKQLKNGFDQYLKIEGTGPRSDLIVTPVARQYYSVYKCIATNVHGSIEHDMQLKEATVPGNVQAAMPRGLTATTITFEITGPSTELGLPVTAYSVQYKEEINPDWSTAQNRSWSPDSPYIVEGLKPQTAYTFRFAARNQRGIGQWSAMRTQSTPKRSAPEEPRPLHSPVQNDKEDPVVVSPYSDHFELRWSVPADNGEPIDFYQVKYCPGMKVSGIWEELAKECRSTDVVESTSFEMSKLSGNTYYRIELRAHNAIGFSSPASIIMKTTRDNPYTAASATNSPTSWSRCCLLLLLAGMTIIATTPSTTLGNIIGTDRKTEVKSSLSLSTSSSLCSSSLKCLHAYNSNNGEKYFSGSNIEYRTKTISTLLTVNDGVDVVQVADRQVLSSASIVGIAVGGVLILLIIVDLLCCVTVRMGVIAAMCRKTKRSPSEIDEETKLGSLYGWRFPLPYCSGQLVKEPPPSPLPLPPPVKLGGSPLASPLDEKQPLHSPPGSIKKDSSLEFDGKFVHSRSGEIIGKNSAV